VQVQKKKGRIRTEGWKEGLIESRRSARGTWKGKGQKGPRNRATVRKRDMARRQRNWSWERRLRARMTSFRVGKIVRKTEGRLGRVGKRERGNVGDDRLGRRTGQALNR